MHEEKISLAWYTTHALYLGVSGAAGGGGGAAGRPGGGGGAALPVPFEVAFEIGGAGVDPKPPFGRV